jgi:hypothetical protein
MIPQPKFAIGDVVFVGTSEYMTSLVTCSSCLGTRVCKVTTASGDEWEAPCGGCVDGWSSTGKQKVHSYQPIVRSLTIGGVRIDTEDKDPICYMALETGVGSGSLWYEKDMSADYETALSFAKARAARNTEDLNERNRKDAEYKRKQAVRRPSHEQRRIKDLEKELKALKANEGSK